MNTINGDTCDTGTSVVSRYHKLDKELLWKVAENHVPEVLGIVLNLREKAAFYPDEDFLNIGSKRSD